MPMAKTPLQFGEWRPDIALLDNQFAAIAENVYPAPNSYLPFLGLVPRTTPLPAPAKGLTFARTSSGAYVIYAGTATKLYKWSGTAWTDVSRATGGAYAVADDALWSFAQFGDQLVAVHPGDEPQVADITAGTAFTALGGNPPNATSVAVVGDFLVLSGLTTNNRMIKWSGINNIEQWTVGLELSDEQEFPDGGPVIGVAGGESGFVVQDRSLRTMQFLPGQTDVIFSFSRIEREKGCMAKYGFVFTRGVLFLVSEDGFYGIGAQNPSIGDHIVNQWFLDHSDPERRHMTLAFADPRKPHVMWAFYSAGTSAIYDRIIIHDWSLNRWSYSTQAAQIGARWRRRRSISTPTIPPIRSTLTSTARRLRSTAPLTWAAAQCRRRSMSTVSWGFSTGRRFLPSSKLPRGTCRKGSARS